ncbi:MAG: MBL fold metallo-hydrolase [Candidatus Saccharimonadales bacterium]
MLEKITDGVWVHQSELMQNNCTVVQGNDGVLVTDPGLTENEMTDLVKDIKELGQTVTAGFSTHPDWDHVLWHNELGNAPRYATAKGAAFMQDFRAKTDWKELATAALPEEIATEVPLDLFGLLTALSSDATELTWNGPVIKVIEHAAHAQGHAALFLVDKGVLIAGDMLSDVFMPMLKFDAKDPISDYLAALNLFSAIADKITAIVPGHGSVAKGEHIKERIELDRAYVEALRDGVTPDDSRINSSAKEGWEWVAGIHEWQAKQIAEKYKQA